MVQWRFGPPVPKTIAEANNPDTAATTEKTWRERERETQRQREREREGEGIRKGILTVVIWNAVDTANDIKCHAVLLHTIMPDFMSMFRLLICISSRI